MAISELAIIRLVLGVVGTIVYTLVGRTVGQRRTFAEGNIGIRAFQIWWYGLAILTLFGPLMAFLDQFPATGALFTLRLFLLQAILILLVAALGGLLYYLLYVYTGKTWIFWIVAAYVIIELSWLMTLINQAHAVDYGPHCPNGSFCYANDVSGTPASTLLSLSFFLPILLATGAYFALFFRVEEPTQRARVAMVAASLLLWFGSGFLASFIRTTAADSQGVVKQMPLSQSPYWSSVISPLISLTASLVIYWAYRLRPAPPAPMGSGPAAGTAVDPRQTPRPDERAMPATRSTHPPGARSPIPSQGAAKTHEINFAAQT